MEALITALLALNATALDVALLVYGIRGRRESQARLGYGLTYETLTYL